MQKRLLALATIAVLSSSAVGLASNDTPQVSYDVFIGLPAAERSAAFRRMAPTDQQLILSTHFNRWLEANRHRLSASQIKLVEEARDAFWRQFMGPPLVNRGLHERLRCGLWRSDLHALNFLEDAQPRSFITDLDDWFFECVYTKAIDAVF